MNDYNNAADLLWKMDQDERNIAFLHYYEGKALDEIAELLNMDIRIVSNQLTSAKKTLKQYL